MVGTVGNITDTDLRRALALYLLGFMSYSAFLTSYIGNLLVGFVSDPTTPESAFTPRWIIVGSLVTSVYIIIISQLWYLRTKHALNKHGSPMNSLGTYLIEMLVFFSVIFPLSIFAVIDSELIDPLIEPSFWLLLIGVPIYCPIILYWNIKLSVDRWYPNRDLWVKIGVSAILGLMSALAIMFLLMYVTLVILSSVI
jgi:hypothetical protein